VPYPPCTVTISRLKYQDPARCLRRVTQPRGRLAPSLKQPNRLFLYARPYCRAVSHDLKHSIMKTLTQHLLLLVITAIVISGCQKTLKGDLIIKNVNLIDVKSEAVNKCMDISIIGDCIAHIDRHRNRTYIAPQIIDGTDQYLIPGLWDMHTHTWLDYKDFFPLLLANGITGIRDMWGNLNELIKIREEIKNGIIAGPEIISAGAIVDGKLTVLEGSYVADTPEKGREIVIKQKADGADFIKVYSRLEREVYFAIADECKKQNIPLCGHIPEKITLEEAIIAGQQSSEHYNGIMEFMSSKKDYYYSVLRGEIRDSALTGTNSSLKRIEFLAQTFDKGRIDDLIKILSKSNMWIDPTWVVIRTYAYLNDSSFTRDDRIYYMPEYFIKYWDPKRNINFSRRTDADYDVERDWDQKGLSIMKQMLEGGVKFLAGTDYPNPYCFPGFSLHDELQIFVEKAGFTPWEALKTATINPAIFLKKDKELGTIEKGKKANLVMLSANPLENINNTRQIEGIALRGKYYEGNILKEQIEKIAKKNRLPKIKEIIEPIILSKGIDAAISFYYELKETKPDNYNFEEKQLNELGYHLISLGKLKEAVRIFELNIEIFPEYANGYDSLGDGYLAVGEKHKALKVWEKAVTLGFGYSKDKIERLKK